MGNTEDFQATSKHSNQHLSLNPLDNDGDKGAKYISSAEHCTIYQGTTTPNLDGPFTGEIYSIRGPICDIAFEGLEDTRAQKLMKKFSSDVEKKKKPPVPKSQVYDVVVARQPKSLGETSF